MRDAWSEKTLGDLVEFQRGFDLPATERVEGEFPVIAATGQVGTHKEARAEGPGVVIGRSGSIGGGQYVQSSFWPLNTTLWVKDFKGNDPRFVYYLVQSIDFAQFNVGSGVPTLNRNHIHRISVRFPEDIGEQRAIAAVLGALDDKIDQNRRTSRALEKLAQATFKAWFVDFEPVKGKAEGQTSFPGMCPEAFAALPNYMTDSSLGPVPCGWTVRTLAEAFDINPPRRLSKGQDAPYLDMKNMPTDGHTPDAWERRPHGSGMRFINGDTLVARITPCLENGKTAYVDFLTDGEVAWGSTEYIVLRPKPPLPEIYAYCLARTPEFRDFAIQNMTGTSGRQRVAASALEHYSVAIPDEMTAAAFGDFASPLFEWIRAGKAESSRLATLRDYLLPKLLSGSVCVSSMGARHEGDLHPI